MNQLEITEILKYLPHRHPFLLVDRVVDFEAGKYIKAIKNVTYNEPFFAGHFPQIPIMPGVLILEALAQTAGILAYKSTTAEISKDSLVYFAGIDEARFKKIVIPGDQLVLEAELLRVKREIWKFKTTATVDGQLACSADLLAARREIQSD